ncbi:MAG: hypothetical protein L0Y55_20810 [Anaerolineales bacterium]|nr:hypothetical protein [Anaerolineales bacterium]
MTKKISALDRVVLLATGLLAAYQIVVGVDKVHALAGVAYTLAFGVLLIAGLLLIIFGFDALASPHVIVVAALIPVGLATGLIAQFIPEWGGAFALLALVGLLALAITRYRAPKKIATLVLILTHGSTGLVIFVLPLASSARGDAPPGFALVGVGGALIGIGGLLLAFLKTGKPLLSEKMILTVLPGLLLLMTALFVAGFALV